MRTGKLITFAVFMTILVAACHGYQGSETNAAAITENQAPVSTNDPNQPIWFISPTNGSSVIAAPRAAGASVVDVRVQVNVPGVSFVSLDMDGSDTLFAQNPGGKAVFEAQFSWQPARGDGSYTLTAVAFGSQKDVLGTATVQLTVSGSVALAATATEVVVPPTSVVDQIKAIYQQQFNLDVPFPAVAHKNRSGVITDPWVSTTWLGNMVYQVYLYPDGRVDAYTSSIDPYPVNTTSGDNKALLVCKPLGAYRMLVVFVDDGNLGINSSEILADLRSATDAANAAFAAYGNLLQIQTTGIVIPVPVNLPADGHLTPELVQSLTGIDPGAYDWLGQVDLDSNNTTRLKDGSMDQTSFGYALGYGACGYRTSNLDIWVTVDNKNELTGTEGRLLTTLLSHEVYHLFGYPASHFWACTDGTMADPSDMCDYRNIPSLLLGWTDTDGDGVAEIIDPTPYGMTSK